MPLPLCLPPTARLWLTVLRRHTSHPYTRIATILSRKFKLNLSAEEAEAAGDKAYTMVVWSKKEDKMVGEVIMEAESWLRVRLGVDGERVWGV
ncbi:MAG: hypothetical protein Q9169_001570 [Polycauliona sp. 2 TL-2023]